MWVLIWCPAAFSTSLPVQWTGFADPQTGIREFSWCVGLAPGRCDVTNQTRALLSRAVHRAGLSLPVATPLYVTVWAVNAAGLDTASVSDSFTGRPVSCRRHLISSTGAYPLTPLPLPPHPQTPTPTPQWPGWLKDWLVDWLIDLMTDCKGHQVKFGLTVYLTQNFICEEDGESGVEWTTNTGSTVMTRISYNRRCMFLSLP